MERELQLELLEKLIQAHIKNCFVLPLQYSSEELLEIGLDSLSKCLAKKIDPISLIKKMDWEGHKKINEYCQFWAKKIVKDYEKELRE